MPTKGRFLKRRIALVLLLLCLCSLPVLTDTAPLVTVTAQAASKYTGWKKKKGKYYYYKKGKLQKNWLTLSGRTYYLGGNGVRRTGFFSVGGKKYYANGSGVVQKGTFKVSGKTYYANSSGVIQTGWYTVSGKTFYANASGVLQTGLKTVDGQIYYFYPNSSGHALGQMATGWATVNGTRYYFYKSDNTAHKDGHLKGAAAIGWETLSGRSYYFLSASEAKKQNKKTGAMATGWQTIGESRYYFYGSDMPAHKSFHYKGAMAMGWESLSGRIYYFLNESQARDQGKMKGAMAIGWQTISGNRYYFYGSDKPDHKSFHYKGAAAMGWETLEGTTYYFGNDHRMVTHAVVDAKYLDHTGACVCDVISLADAGSVSAWDASDTAYGTRDLVFIPAGTLLRASSGYEFRIYDLFRDRDFGAYTGGITAARDIFARISIRKASAEALSEEEEMPEGLLQTALADSAEGQCLAASLKESRLDPARSLLYEVAHRGAAFYGPENTMTAFRNAVALGYKAVETDIRFTADGVPVLLHDPGIERVSDGEGEIKDLTLEEALSYDYAADNDYYEEEALPTLEEFLSYAGSERILQFLELKEEYDEEQLGLLNSLADRVGDPDRIVWLVWDYHSNLARMNQIADKRSRIAVLTEEISESVIEMAALAAAETGRSVGISAYQKGWTRELFDQALDQGIFLSIWTVNSPGYAANLMDWYGSYLEEHGGTGPEVSLTTNGGTDFAAILTARGLSASLYERKEAGLQSGEEASGELTAAAEEEQDLAEPESLPAPAPDAGEGEEETAMLSFEGGTVPAETQDTGEVPVCEPAEDTEGTDLPEAETAGETEGTGLLDPEPAETGIEDAEAPAEGGPEQEEAPVLEISETAQDPAGS